MAEVKGIYLRKLPIAITDSITMNNVENLVKNLIKLCETRYTTKHEFISFIINAYEPKKFRNN